MGLNIDKEMVERIKRMIAIPWKNKVRYLGINFEIPLTHESRTPLRYKFGSSD